MENKMDRNERLRLNWQKNGDKYNAQRKEKRRKEKEDMLLKMIAEYNDGVSLISLCEKYGIRFKRDKK